MTWQRAVRHVPFGGCERRDSVRSIPRRLLYNKPLHLTAAALCRLSRLVLPVAW
jgi:hypothetical protein